ncbi:MAG: stage II sporulation protein R [Eubacteriales bacterium]|nr:stage II sporulation protein R [Eubacteriales bacterium]
MLKSKGRILEASLLTALSLSLCVGTWASSKHSELSSQLVRLHVIAVSDDEYEQAIKLGVRDSVLAYLTPMLENVSDITDAKSIIGGHLTGIAEAAGKAAEGREVTVKLGRESYPTRHYDTFSLPAGEYDSLRIVLGEGKGHNWWCVVFPPLCTVSTGADEIKSVMNKEDYSIITEEEGYVLKFRTLELWGKINDFLKSA